MTDDTPSDGSHEREEQQQQQATPFQGSSRHILDQNSKKKSKLEFNSFLFIALCSL
jgi:hypothetical protein